MRKWRDIERQMAPSSQMFSQGGIRSRDWFSDRLGIERLKVTLRYFLGSTYSTLYSILVIRKL
jgi:hypothetical protein